jgi:hypothetical protein
MFLRELSFGALMLVMTAMTAPAALLQRNQQYSSYWLRRWSAAKFCIPPRPPTG